LGFTKTDGMRTVTTERGKVIVDDTAINVNDTYTFNGNCYTLRVGDTVGPDCHKIIATINFSVDKDVAMVMMEDYEIEELLDSVEHIAVVKAREKYSYSEASGRGTMDKARKIEEYKEHFNDGVIEGYKAAQQKGVYSEEDMYMLAGKVTDDIAKNKSNAAWCFFTTPKMIADEYIQSLNKDHVELEMEEVYFHGSGYYKKEELSLEKQTRYSFMKETRIKTTRNSSNQLIAYAK